MNRRKKRANRNKAKVVNAANPEWPQKERLPDAFLEMEMLIRKQFNEAEGEREREREEPVRRFWAFLL